jgi:alpha-galactosidase
MEPGLRVADDLGRACTRFITQVGVYDEVSNPSASVRFQVYGEGRLLAYSPVKTGADGPTRLTVSTGGYTTLELRVTDARNGTNFDNADWGAATLTCTSPGTGSPATWIAATNGWGPGRSRHVQR